jgi:curved DNA-binding protein CbpA
MKATHYDVLGISKDAHQDQIREAYLKKVFALHPDKSFGAADMFQRMQQAWLVLSDCKLRGIYDKKLLMDLNSRTRESINFSGIGGDPKQALIEHFCRCGYKFNFSTIEFLDFKGGEDEEIVIACENCSLELTITFATI